jgi:hypothetical protein
MVYSVNSDNKNPSNTALSHPRQQHNKTEISKWSSSISVSYWKVEFNIRKRFMAIRPFHGT